MDENSLKLQVLEKLSDDFYFKPECRGVNLVEKTQVIIDFLAKAKTHIVNDGFTHEWFGVEVKYIPNANSAKKMKQALWQSITYAQSVYDKYRPPFVFLFTNSEVLDIELRAIYRFCQYGNVGLLNIDNGYSFTFGSQHYYANRDGIRHKGKTNAGQIRYAGNMLGNKSKARSDRGAAGAVEGVELSLNLKEMTDD